MIIVPFSQIKPDHLASVGSKAYSLGRLVQGKFKVPEGFVISSDAFAFFLKETGIGVTIQAELSKISLDDLHSVDYASRFISDLILGAEMPAELSTVIMQQFMHIPSDYVAVRSSAFSDQHQVAWSGELASFLNINATNLSSKIKECWASLFSTRSIYYFLQQKLDIKTVNIAVVIQRMVEAKASGRAYSVHPVTQDKDQLVIEAEVGLGDTKEAGEITPDTYVVQVSTEKIIDKNIHDQAIIIEPDESGTHVSELSDVKGHKQKLSDQKIIELSKLSKKIESYLGHPVDIEWVLEDDFYFLQTRKLEIS